MHVVYYTMSLCFIFFFKQKTAYEMRISDWSSDVCSSDLWCAEEFTLAKVAQADAISVGRAIENDIRRGGDCDGIDWGSSWSEAGPELVEDRLFRDADYVRGGARVGGRDDL